MSEFEFFDNTDNKIKNLIKEKGYETCKKEFSKDFILRTINKMEFGIVHKGIIAQIGQKKRKTNNEYLYSFILCKINKKNNSIFIDLICNKNTQKKKVLN